MFSRSLPLIGPGRVLLGEVNASAYLASVSESRLAGTIYVVRKDQNGSVAFTDLSSRMVDPNTTDAFWGSALNSGDVTYVACDDGIKRIWVEIVTPGVWTGDANIGIRYSSGGVYADKELTPTSDGTNGLRAAAGIRSIEITWPSDIVAFSPQPGSAAEITAGQAVASRRWLGLYPKGLTASTTAAVVRRMWIEHIDSAITYIDLLSQVNAAISPAPAQNTVSFFPLDGASVYYCTNFPSSGERRYIYKAQAANRTRVQEYLASDDSWKPLTVSDPSNDFTSGPASYQTTPQEFEMSWATPSDWASKARTFGAVTATGYWRRIRTTAVTTVGVMDPVTAVLRARQFGAANTSGPQFSQATSLRSASLKFNGAIQGAGAVDLSLVDLATGAARTLNIPSSVAQSADLNVSFTAMSVTKPGLFYSTGTRQFADVDLLIEE